MLTITSIDSPGEDENFSAGAEDGFGEHARTVNMQIQASKKQVRVWFMNGNSPKSAFNKGTIDVIQS